VGSRRRKAWGMSQFQYWVRFMTVIYSSFCKDMYHPRLAILLSPLLILPLSMSD
jgi:hypothetical protein